MFSAHLPVYLIWIEPNDYPYYYTPEDLGAIAEVEPLFVNQDGGVYQLTPKPVNAP